METRVSLKYFVNNSRFQILPSTNKFETNFLKKIPEKNGYFQSKTEKINVTIEFFVFGLI